MKSFSLFLLILVIFSFNSCSQTRKIPISIEIDTLRKDTLKMNLNKYHISYNFKYDKNNRLIKMIDSTKKGSKIIIQELELTYNKGNGKLKNYTYKKNTEVIHHDISYVNNKVILKPENNKGTEFTFTLDKFGKAIKIERLSKTNSFFNSIITPIYYDNENIKQIGNWMFEYNRSKGMFADVNMEPWLRLYFFRLLIRTNLNFSKNLIKELNKKPYSKTKFVYEITNDYPSKIIYPVFVYKVNYKKI